MLKHTSTVNAYVNWEDSWNAPNENVFVIVQFLLLVFRWIHHENVNIVYSFDPLISLFYTVKLDVDGGGGW